MIAWGFNAGVADTSPINYLILIQHETLLPALYTHVVIPPAVQRELQDLETPTVVRAWAAHPLHGLKSEHSNTQRRRGR
jgi:predicted nucleic acid-binding protein